MFRIILFSIIAYFLFKVIGKIFFNKKNQHTVFSKKPSPGVIDEMVQDPVCKIYLPKKEAIGHNCSGEMVFFCSRNCLEKFKSEQKKS